MQSFYNDAIQAAAAAAAATSLAPVYHLTFPSHDATSV